MSLLPAKADTYTFNTDHCSGGGCGTGIGEVLVTQNGAGTVSIDVKPLLTGFEFVSSGAGTPSKGPDKGVDGQFFFNIQAVSGGNADNPTISVSNLTAGWELVSTTAGSYAGDGLSEEFEYALTCNFSGGACSGGGASNPASLPLKFDLTATGLTPTSFDDPGGTSGVNTAEFAADVIANGNTGLIGASLTSVVPEPATLLPLSGLLFGMGIVVRKRIARD